MKQFITITANDSFNNVHTFLILIKIDLTISLVRYIIDHAILFVEITQLIENLSQVGLDPMLQKNDVSGSLTNTELMNNSRY
ncbi:MAG TPA: hypothetical protein VD815_06925 [Candidatus Saccharimonadales bacterium]|nr:hypothetical protein [Candidatus Saccharimonadales bacterium]